MPNPCVDYFWGNEEGPGIVPLDPAEPPEAQRFVVWLRRRDRKPLRLAELSKPVPRLCWDIPPVYSSGSDFDYFLIEAIDGAGAVCASWRWPQGKNARLLGPDTSGVARALEPSLDAIRADIRALADGIMNVGQRLDLAPKTKDVDGVISDVASLRTEFRAHVGAGATPHDYSEASLVVKELCVTNAGCQGPFRVAWEGNTLRVSAGPLEAAWFCHSDGKWRWFSEYKWGCCQPG